MGRQALIGAVVWLTLSGTLAVNLVYKDNVSAQSGQRVYRNWPMMYASAAPYGAYSIPVPFYAAPKPAASNVAPVKETLVYNNPKGYFKQNNGFFNLKDSYGNRYVQSPHSVPLKPSFPQQFLQLQDLPAHFAQPLSAAPANYNNYNSYNGFRQSSAAPQTVYGHYKLPVQSSAPSTPAKHFSFSQIHPSAYTDSIKSFGTPSVSHFQSPILRVPPGYTAGLTLQRTPTVEPELLNNQQESISSEAIYSSTQTPKIYHHISEPQYEPIQPDSEELYDEDKRQAVRTVKKKLKKVPVRETQVNTVVNGQKTVVNLKTKPTVPLLDISLLEPLTFDNPLVPQVQHFLPRIKEATYHKLPELSLNENKKYHKEYSGHKTKSYDGGVYRGKSKKKTSKRKHKYPSIQVHTTYGDEITQASTARPTIVESENANESPEITYEINSPNHKETVKEKTISYNKETNSEPVHYSYGTSSHKEPVHYTYIHSSKEPVHIKEVRYESYGESPPQEHNSKPQQEQNKENEDDHSSESDESSEDSEEDGPTHKYHHQHREENTKHHQSKPKQREEEYHHESKPRQREDEYHHESKPRQREEEYHHESKPKQREEEYQHQSKSTPHNNVQHKEVQSAPPSTHYFKHQSFQPVAQFEEEVRIAAPIKVNPNQHIQHKHPEPQQQPTPQFKPLPTQHTHHHSPTVRVHEKSKQVIIQKQSSDDEPKKNDKDEDKEKDFEKAYKDAAYGFPAYNSPSVDVEKDIYNPESYGIPRDHATYSINHSPFQQYQAQGDRFPKTTRLNYMDTRDKTKEDYFLDYSISKPESMTDHYKKKIDYYKLYKQQKPEKFGIIEKEEDKKKSQNLMYSAIPYSYYPTFDQMSKLMSAQYKTMPFVQQFSFPKSERRDNSAHASGPPFQTINLNTRFVEPQFQYGFEPISLPQLLDSELAAMATNNSPESDKPAQRKKIYKENFYIKTTNTDDGEPNS